MEKRKEKDYKKRRRIIGEGKKRGLTSHSRPLKSGKRK